MVTEIIESLYHSILLGISITTMTTMVVVDLKYFVTTGWFNDDVVDWHEAKISIQDYITQLNQLRDKLITFLEQKKKKGYNN